MVIYGQVSRSDVNEVVDEKSGEVTKYRNVSIEGMPVIPSEGVELPPKNSTIRAEVSSYRTKPKNGEKFGRTIYFLGDWEKARFV